MIIDDLIQRTPEWFAMRHGCCTASRLNDALAKLRDPKKESAARANAAMRTIVTTTISRR